MKMKISIERPEILCDENCRYLNITEEVQDELKLHTVRHFCWKYGKTLHHEFFHPQIIKSEKCIDRKEK